MKTAQAFGAFFLLAYFVFVSPVFAGGPHFSLYADSYGSTNSDGTYGRIMRFVSQERPCEGTQVTFKFVEPKDGDYIMTTSGSATYTFTKDSPPYYQDGQATCGTTAKMGSKTKGMRQVTFEVKNSPEDPIINVDFDGKYYADNSYNGYNYWSSQDSPAYRLTHNQSSTPQTPSNLRITQIETTGDPNIRNVHLMWNPISGVNTYNIYKNAGSSYYYYTTVDTNLYEMKVNIGSTFYVAVTAKKDGLESPYSTVTTIDLANSKYIPPVTISNTINTWVLNQQLDNNNRQVTLKWSAFGGNPGIFSVLAKSETNKTNWDKIAWEQRGPSVIVTIPNEDYYLKMYGCADKYGNCTDSNILWLPKITIENGTVVVPSVVPVTSNAKIDELDKKVNDLQNQLDQSKKTQSSLEQRINDLVSFIRKIFPFFK